MGNLVSILSFLEHLFSSDRVHSTINVTRSMLSAILPPIDGIAIGKHPLIVGLMRAINNKNLHRARYSHMWDVGNVLNYINSTNLDELSLSDISWIVATLLVINTMVRVAELASVLRKSVVFTPTEATLDLSLRSDKFIQFLRVETNWYIKV